MIFDTHAHYDDARFDEDRALLLEKSFPEGGIAGLVNVGASLRSSRASRDLAERYGFIFFAAGVHPDDTSDLEEAGPEAAEAELKALLEHPKAVAVGEIGLDYHGDYPDKPSPAQQKRWFDFQLALAKEKKMPVIVHSRDAAADTLSVLQAAGGSELSLVMHCFSYEKEMAKIYLDMGYYLGAGGVVTYKNSRKLKEIVRYMPLDRLLLETDAPYLPPEPWRGTRNQSLHLHRVAEVIAELREIRPEEVEEAARQNAMRFFRLAETSEKALRKLI